jgi:hypothetical protein
MNANTSLTSISAYVIMQNILYLSSSFFQNSIFTLLLQKCLIPPLNNAVGTEFLLLVILTYLLTYLLHGAESFLRS